MDSVVQKLHRIIILIFIAGCLHFRMLGRLLYQPLAAQTVEREKDTDNESKETVIVSHEGSVSLDRRLERSVKTIEIKRKDPLEQLEPAIIRLSYQRLSLKEPDLISTISLIHGLIQKISMDKDTCQQGEVATLNVTTVLPLENPKINFLYRTYKLYPVSNNIYQTILAVPMNTDPGTYSMTLKYEEKGTQKNLELPFEVIPAHFSEEDTAELDVHVLTEETLEMLKYEGNYFARAYRMNPDSMLYEDDFIWPCAGTITGLYGTPRRYNEDLDKWSHKAIDIANAVGTKVYAANHGVIAMAKNLDVHGKSIVIAHGMGIHTVYIHLDEICVEKKDKVKKGQLIGRLGKTGLCTGPNLHWQVMVNRVATNPQFWLKGQPEVKEKQWVRPELPRK